MRTTTATNQGNRGMNIPQDSYRLSISWSCFCFWNFSRVSCTKSVFRYTSTFVPAFAALYSRALSVLINRLIIIVNAKYPPSNAEPAFIEKSGPMTLGLYAMVAAAAIVGNRAHIMAGFHLSFLHALLSWEACNRFPRAYSERAVHALSSWEACNRFLRAYSERAVHALSSAFFGSSSWGRQPSIAKHVCKFLGNIMIGFRPNCTRRSFFSFCNSTLNTLSGTSCIVVPVAELKLTTKRASIGCLSFSLAAWITFCDISNTGNNLPFSADKFSNVCESNNSCFSLSVSFRLILSLLRKGEPVMLEAKWINKASSFSCPSTRNTNRKLVLTLSAKTLPKNPLEALISEIVLSEDNQLKSSGMIFLHLNLMLVSVSQFSLIHKDLLFCIAKFKSLALSWQSFSGDLVRGLAGFTEALGQLSYGRRAVS
jgi:hypothetical protein